MRGKLGDFIASLPARLSRLFFPERRATPPPAEKEVKGRPLKEGEDALAPQFRASEGTKADVTLLYAAPWLVALFLLTLLILLGFTFLAARMDALLSLAVSFALALLVTAALAILLRPRKISTILVSGAVTALLTGCLPSAAPGLKLNYTKGETSITIDFALIDKLSAFVWGAAIFALLFLLALSIQRSE